MDKRTHSSRIKVSLNREPPEVLSVMLWFARFALFLTFLGAWYLFLTLILDTCFSPWYLILVSHLDTWYLFPTFLGATSWEPARQCLPLNSEQLPGWVFNLHTFSQSGGAWLDKFKFYLRFDFYLRGEGFGLDLGLPAICLNSNRGQWERPTICSWLDLFRCEFNRWQSWLHLLTSE